MADIQNFALRAHCVRTACALRAWHSLCFQPFGRGERVLPWSGLSFPLPAHHHRSPIQAQSSRPLQRVPVWHSCALLHALLHHSASVTAATVIRHRLDKPRGAQSWSVTDTGCPRPGTSSQCSRCCPQSTAMLHPVGKTPPDMYTSIRPAASWKPRGEGGGVLQNRSRWNRRRHNAMHPLKGPRLPCLGPGMRLYGPACGPARPQPLPPPRPDRSPTQGTCPGGRS